MSLKTLSRFVPQVIISTQTDELIVLCITFLRNSEYIKNPYLKSGLVSLLFHGTWPVYHRQKGVLGDALTGEKFANDHLLHALMKFYIGMLESDYVVGEEETLTVPCRGWVDRNSWAVLWKVQYSIRNIPSHKMYMVEWYLQTALDSGEQVRIELQKCQIKKLTGVQSQYGLLCPLCQLAS